MNGKVKSFHQFVKVERGPVNAALIDLLKGQVYQVENSLIDALEQGRYEDIPEFLTSAGKENLIIEVDDRTWIPSCGEYDEILDDGFIESEFNIELHVEEGIDLEAVFDKLKNHNIYRVVFYGQEIPQISRQVKIVRKEKDFGKCAARVYIDGEFEPITENIYKFHRTYNSCWGEKMAVSAEGEVKPCIHSTIVVGDIERDDIDDILEKLQEYWQITKDKVEKCKVCELRHVCFDCREIARREGGDLFSAPPTCSYDPYKGTWNG